MWGVTTRFDRLSPDPAECLAALSRAINIGDALVATLNPQTLYPRADAWHHQFIYGVDPAARLVFLANPIEAVPIDAFLILCRSRPVLAIRWGDLLSRGWPDGVMIALAGGLTEVSALESALDSEIEAAILANAGPVPPTPLWREGGVIKRLAALLLETAGVLSLGDESVKEARVAIPASCE